MTSDEVVFDEIELDPEDEAPALRLTEKETLQLSRAHAESRATRSEMVVLQYERAAYLNRVDPEGVLRGIDSRIAAKKSELIEAQRAEKEVRTAIEGRLGVDLAKYSYDDRTGTMHELPKEG